MTGCQQGFAEQLDLGDVEIPCFALLDKRF
jgi:hypothetical protein